MVLWVIQFYPGVAMAPIIAITTIIFIYHRRRYIVADRVPWLGVFTGAIVCLTCIMYAILPPDSDRQDCYYNVLTVTIICMPLGIWTFVCRAGILLFRFEITADVNGRKKASSANQSNAFAAIDDVPGSPSIGGGRDGHGHGHGPAMDSKNAPLSPSLPVPAAVSVPVHGDTIGGGGGGGGGMMKPKMNDSPETSSSNYSLGGHTVIKGVSWYTRHHRFIRGRYIGTITAILTCICIIIWLIVAIGQDNRKCSEVRHWWLIALYGSITLCVIQGILLVVIARKLARHGNDSLFIKHELTLVGVLVLFSTIILYPTFIIGLKIPSSWPIVLILDACVAWFMSIIMPLILCHRHYGRQRALVNQVAQWSSLETFLCNATCIRYYAQFAAAEFSGESLAFLLRCRAYRAQGGGGNQHLTANNGGTATAAATSVADIDRIILLSQPSSKKHGSSSAASHHPTTAASRLLREAYQIYRSFVAESSPFEVNLSAAVKNRLVTQLQTLTTAVAASTREHHTMVTAAITSPVKHSPATVAPAPSSPATHPTTTAISDADRLLIRQLLDVYTEAMNEIMQLLQTNSWLRFRASSAYKRLLVELEHQHGSDGLTNAAIHGGAASIDDIAAAAAAGVAISSHLTAPPPTNAWVIQQGSSYKNSNPHDLKLGDAKSHGGGGGGDVQSLLLISENGSGMHDSSIVDTGRPRHDSIASHNNIAVPRSPAVTASGGAIHIGAMAAGGVPLPMTPSPLPTPVLAPLVPQISGPGGGSVGTGGGGGAHLHTSILHTPTSGRANDTPSPHMGGGVSAASAAAAATRQPLLLHPNSPGV